MQGNERYLTPADYAFVIRDDVLGHIGDGSPRRLLKAEEAAAKIMKSHLHERYDVAKILFPLSEHVPGRGYAPGQLVYWKPQGEPDDAYAVYQASANTASTPPGPGWGEFKGRDAMAMMYLADIAVYHFMAADTPGFALDNIKDRHREAMHWLRAVGKGEKDPGLPQRPGPGRYQGDFRFFSHPRENEFW